MSTESSRTTVYLADDHPVFREAVGRAISSRPEFRLAGQAGDGQSALREIRELRPAVAVLDQQLPHLSGVEILRAVRRDELPTRVLILSGDESSGLVYEAVTLGATGYLTKTSTLAEICDAVSAAARGVTALAPDIQTSLLAEMRDRAAATDSTPKLTPREREILRLVADGRSVPEIAAQLYVSPSTVKTHVKGLYEKLGVGDRAAAVAEGMRRGLLE